MTYAPLKRPTSTTTPAAKSPQRRTPRPRHSTGFDANPHAGSEAVHLQPKLLVGATHDPLEQEADRLAKQFVDGPRVAALPLQAAAAPNARLLRKCDTCTEDDTAEDQPLPPLRRTATPSPGQPFQAPDGFSARLHSARSEPTQPLAPALRNALEHHFQTDLDHVKLHNTPSAHDLAKDINARAFTHNNDIFFARGQFNPHIRNGQHRLAHELAHTLQHKASQNSLVRRSIDDGDVETESELNGKIRISIGSGSDHITVNSDAEAYQARQMVAAIKEKYGVEINSDWARDEIEQALRKRIDQNRRGDPTDLEEKMLGGLAALRADWTLEELEAVQEGLAAYKDVLGYAGQKLKYVGYLRGDLRIIDPGLVDTGSPGLKGRAYKKGFFLVKPSSDTTYERVRDVGANTPASRRRLDVIHEVGHVLGAEFLKMFKDVTGYWVDGKIKTGKVGAEAPPTLYGDTSVNEDLAETLAHHVAKTGVLEKGTPIITHEDGTKEVNQIVGKVPPHGEPGNPTPVRAAFAARVVEILKLRKRILPRKWILPQRWFHDTSAK